MNVSHATIGYASRRTFARSNTCMKKRLFLIALMAFCVAFYSHSQSMEVRQRQYNVKKNVALEGYDPVSYFANKPVKGSADFPWVFQGLTYHFANVENLNRFKASPGKYEPAYGGWCAYAMGESGEKVKVDPETFKIVNEKLYLFYNFWGNNTLEDWNKNEKSLLSRADQNWKKFVP